MRAAISLLVLLLSMCGVQTESNGTDFDLSTELKELRDMVVELKGRHVASESKELKELRDLVVELRVTLRHTRDDVKVLEADNVAMKGRLEASESKVEALETENKAMKQRLVVSESKVELLEADNVAMKGRLVASETKVEALERALQDTKAEMKTEVDNLKKENAATEKKVDNLEKEIRAAPKVAFSAGLGKDVYTEAGSKDLNVVFKRVITNVGEAYSSTTGFFTAPVRGVYYFRFTVMDKLSTRFMSIMMHKNGQQLMWLGDYDTDGQSSYLSSGLALQLEKGDTVNMVLPAGRRLYDNSADNHCTFSGFLLFPL